MVRSKLWAAQDALFSIVENAVTLGRDGQITLGSPLELMAENVWVSGEVDDWQTNYRVSGLGSKDEEFTLRVSIACAHLGTDYRDTRLRVEALGQEIEDAIAADHTLAGTCELAVVSSFRLEDSLMGDRTRGVGLNIYVRCTTWLTS